jgi:hypothetical protein
VSEAYHNTYISSNLNYPTKPNLGTSEALVIVLVVIILIVSPIMWIRERSQRKYWQAKAEDYEKRLIDRK